MEGLEPRGLGPPKGWVGRPVRLTFRDRLPEGPDGRGDAHFESIHGVLRDANELGATLERVDEEEEKEPTFSFIPWAAIRGIRLQR